MSTTVRLLATALLAAIIGPQAGLAADHTAVTASSPAPEVVEIVLDEPVEQLVVVGADDEQRTRLDAGIATFEAAGLELPPLVVTFDDTGAACSGHPGYFLPGTPAEISICNDLRHVLLHELAHAWEWHTVEDSTREHFVTDHELPTWNSKDAGWSERGIEHFADAVAIGLVISSGSDNPKIIEKLCTFEAITAVDHAAVTTDDCSPAGA